MGVRTCAHTQSEQDWRRKVLSACHGTHKVASKSLLQDSNDGQGRQEVCVWAKKVLTASFTVVL